MDALPLASAQAEPSTIHESKEVLTNDIQIRKTLKQNLVAAFRTDPDTLILEELGLRHGATRVDIVVVNGCLHGFEVKSDRDSLKRLPRQVRMYGEILDYVTLVVGQRHADKAKRTIPNWWGIQVADRGQDGEVRLQEVRQPLENPNPDRLAIAKLLWRDEAINFLEEIGAADGMRSKPRRFVYSRLAEVAEIDTIRAYVRERLKSRKDWRSDEQRKLCGD